MRPIKIKKSKRSDRFKFTDRTNPGGAYVSCILGISGIAALIFCMIRIYRADGAVSAPQTLTVALAALYGLAGLILGVCMLVKRDALPFFPTLGITVNSILIVLIAGLVAWGFIV